MRLEFLLFVAGMLSLPPPELGLAELEFTTAPIP